jgi:K+-sensing histidine kinase KdpD
MGFTSRRLFDLAVGSIGVIMAGTYFLYEYMEFGGGHGLYAHIMGTDPLLHTIVLAAIPVFAGLGYLMDRRARVIQCYSEDLEKAVEERTATLHRRTVELQKTLNRHESYIFSVADGLRNPLQVFLGNIESMDTSNFTEEQKRVFHDIKKAARRLEANIANLTDRRGIKEAEKEPVISDSREL